MNDNGRDYYEDGTLRCIRPLRDGVSLQCADGEVDAWGGGLLN